MDWFVKNVTCNLFCLSILDPISHYKKDDKIKIVYLINDLRDFPSGVCNNDYNKTTNPVFCIKTYYLCFTDKSLKYYRYYYANTVMRL